MLWDQQQFQLDQGTGSLAFQPFVILYLCSCKISVCIGKACESIAHVLTLSA